MYIWWFSAWRFNFSALCKTVLNWKEVTLSAQSTLFNLVHILMLQINVYIISSVYKVLNLVKHCNITTQPWGCPFLSECTARMAENMQPVCACAPSSGELWDQQGIETHTQTSGFLPSVLSLTFIGIINLTARKRKKVRIMHLRTWSGLTQFGDHKSFRDYKRWVESSHDHCHRIFSLFKLTHKMLNQ